jgi:hypothetical protein
VEALGRWGYQWAAEQLRPDNLDAGLLMWFLRRRVQVVSIFSGPGPLAFLASPLPGWQGAQS